MYRTEIKANAELPPLLTARRLLQRSLDCEDLGSAIAFASTILKLVQTERMKGIQDGKLLNIATIMAFGPEMVFTSAEFLRQNLPEERVGEIIDHATRNFANNFNNTETQQ